MNWNTGKPKESGYYLAANCGSTPATVAERGGRREAYMPRSGARFEAPVALVV